MATHQNSAQDKASDTAKANQAKATDAAKANQDKAADAAKANQDKATDAAKANQDKAADAAKANQDKATDAAKANQDKATDAAKGNIDRTAEQGARIAGAAREGVDKMKDLREKTTENARRIVETSLEAASRQAQEVSQRFTRTFGTGGEEGQRLAEQSKQNLEAVARCGTLLTQAFQDMSRSWFELSQKQLQRNLEGAKKLASAKSVQEFSAIQSELVRESLEQVVQSSRTIAEKSLHVADEAGKVFSNAAKSSSKAR